MLGNSLNPAENKKKIKLDICCARHYVTGVAGKGREGAQNSRLEASKILFETCRKYEKNVRVSTDQKKIKNTIVKVH